ncbi:hypothetical protein ACIBCA_17330 [Kitasatospora sp. NPDC051170]|uniref:hypothetical protein n=1 Tax=Kitasatospora sp. NPDC051170 TaxID=3364056 RepID=UPI00378E89AA
MPVTNHGTRDLCLFIEPICEDYWLKPDETLVLRSEAKDADVWFETYVKDGCISVWLYENGDPYKVLTDYVVVDKDGTRLESGYQRPRGQRWSAAGPILD